MKTPYAEGMLPRREEKLTIRNEKSPHLSFSSVNSFTLPSVSRSRSRYEADFTMSVVSFIVNGNQKINET